MSPVDSHSEKSSADAAASAARGEKVFSVIGFAVKVATVSVVVLGIMMIIIALSGVEDWSLLDEHEVFRYRMVAAPVVIAGYLLFDYLLGRRRAAAAAASQGSQVLPKRGYAIELMALAFVAAGGAAFWHDHISNEIPHPVAVVGQFTSATCVDRSKRGVGPHMAIGYEFPSQSTRVRVPQTQCLLSDCGPEQKPPQVMDTEYKRVFYASLQECRAALPAVLAAKAPTTVWTGDKDPNASVRARFTPEREPPPYFLLWFPAAVAAVVLLISGLVRARQ